MIFFFIHLQHDEFLHHILYINWMMFVSSIFKRKNSSTTIIKWISMVSNHYFHHVLQGHDSYFQEWKLLNQTVWRIFCNHTPPVDYCICSNATLLLTVSKARLIWIRKCSLSVTALRSTRFQVILETFYENCIPTNSVGNFLQENTFPDYNTND